MTSSLRSLASRRTAGATPWALKMARAPAGTSSEFFDKNGAGFPQLVHHVLVMHDFLAHVDRRAVKIESDLDHIDGSHHAGAEAARLQQKNLLVRAGLGAKGCKGIQTNDDNYSRRRTAFASEVFREVVNRLDLGRK